MVLNKTVKVAFSGFIPFIIAKVTPLFAIGTIENKNITL
jgi:hypothetical protein